MRLGVAKSNDSHPALALDLHQQLKKPGDC
jgi:hypothetical protein